MKETISSTLHYSLALGLGPLPSSLALLLREPSTYVLVLRVFVGIEYSITHLLGKFRGVNCKLHAVTNLEQKFCLNFLSVLLAMSRTHSNANFYFVVNREL